MCKICFKMSIPDQGIFAGHRASVSNWPPDLDMYYSDGQTTDRSFQVLCSAPQAQSGWSDPRCFCRQGTIFFASLVLEREKEALGITKNICPYILHSTRVVDIGGFESQDGEDWNGGIYRCSAIYYSYYNSIPLAVVSNRHRREKTELCKPSHKISKFYWQELIIFSAYFAGL